MSEETLPNIQRDRHNGIEKNNIREKHKKSNQGNLWRRPLFSIGNNGIPFEIYCKKSPGCPFPHTTEYRTDKAHGNQKQYYLKIHS